MRVWGLRFGAGGGLFRQGTQPFRKGPNASRQGTKRTHMDPVTSCQLTRRHYSEKDLSHPKDYHTPRPIHPPSAHPYSIL